MPWQLQTYNNYLHIYGMHTGKESVMQGAGISGMQDLKHVDMFLQHSIPVQSAAAATCIVGDSRSILLGLADGTCQVFSWQSKVGTQLATVHGCNRCSIFITLLQSASECTSA